MIPKALEFAKEVALVERRIADALRQGDGLFSDVAAAVLSGSGKKLRPRIVMLMARSLGGDMLVDKRFVDAAACVELVHVASLIHDDVIDRAETRRGNPSINARFGDNVAILMADFLYAQAFEIALDAVGPEMLRIVTRVTGAMCRSEVLQIEKHGSMLSEDDYLGIIEAKTAALLGACAEIGAILAGADEAGRRAAAQYGTDLGMAFQIADDALDYTGGDGHLGKPVGNDLKQGKQTLPLLYTLARAGETDRRALTETLGNGRDMGIVGPLIQKYGGLEYSLRRAREFADRAAARIPEIAPRRDPKVLQMLCRFVVERGS